MLLWDCILILKQTYVKLVLPNRLHMIVTLISHKQSFHLLAHPLKVRERSCPLSSGMYITKQYLHLRAGLLQQWHKCRHGGCREERLSLSPRHRHTGKVTLATLTIADVLQLHSSVSNNKRVVSFFFFGILATHWTAHHQSLSIILHYIYYLIHT